MPRVVVLLGALVVLQLLVLNPRVLFALGLFLAGGFGLRATALLGNQVSARGVVDYCDLVAVLTRKLAVGSDRTLHCVVAVRAVRAVFSCGGYA